MVNRFRFAGIRKPAYLPKVAVSRIPLWEKNHFTAQGAPTNDAANDPIFGYSSPAPFAATPIPYQNPTVVEECFHNRNPGTMYLSQTVDSGMDWGIDKYFAFKCYFQLDSVAGRIPIFYRRSSLQNGGPFIEVRDGSIYAGWYDVDLKEEVWVKTSAPVVEPGYVYYLYYRKWFPRGGYDPAAAPLIYWTNKGSNWFNSAHPGTQSAGTYDKWAGDALIWRRFPKKIQSQSSFSDWTGYDAKSFVKSPAGGANYNYYANFSSARACVSATMEDSDFNPSNPYTAASFVGRSATGIVMSSVALDQAATGVLTTNTVALTAANHQRFVLDHVGMLLQISDDLGSSVNGKVYRIVEFVDALRVKVIEEDSSVPVFAFGAGNQYVSVYMGVSLVKSENYDLSRTPDPSSYAIELFGSSLSTNPLNGVQAFNGKRWSFAYGIFANTSVDVGGNKIGEPDIFEDCSLSRASVITSASEVGTDVFGLQGSSNPLDGRLPWNGVPAGELEVDAGFARSAVDTTPYYPLVWGAVVGSATPPSSTQPDSTLTVPLDAASTGTTDLVWNKAKGVTDGRRLARISFYDPVNNEESEPGDLMSIQVPIEDESNPSSSVSLVFTNLPVPEDMDRKITRRIRVSAANGLDLFVAHEADVSSSYSADVAIDDVAMQQVGGAINANTIATQFGTPPRGKYLCFSQSRLAIGNLEGQPDGVAYSRIFAPGVFPVANVFPVDTGNAEVTGLSELSGALVVFKRNAVMPYKFSDAGLPLLQKSTHGDGCVSAASIVSLEDRVYYLSDRGVMVLLSDWTPFYIGWRMQGMFRTAIDHDALAWAHGGINRKRAQYMLTLRRAGEDSSRLRLGVEFTHPMAGEDFTRTELMSGHRFTIYENPACVSLSSVEPKGGGAEVPVGGTEEGFVVWLDRADTLFCLGGPLAEARLEGDLGVPSSAGLGVSPAYWSTREFDADSPELEKEGRYLDVTRSRTGGTLNVLVFRNQDPASIGTLTIPLDVSFSSEELGGSLQEARSFRLVFQSSDSDFEIFDLTVRQEEVDSR